MLQKVIDVSALRAEQIDPDYFSSVVAYSSPLVRALHWDGEREHLTIDFDGREEELRQLIEQIKQKIGRSIINKRSQALYSYSPNRSFPERNTWNELIAAGMVKDFGHGHVAYSGLFLELVNRFDEAFQQIASKKGAEHIYLPNFLPLDYLKKIGSFDQYPHYLFFITPLIPDIEKIEQFQQKITSDSLQFRDYFSDPEYCLKTSACSLLYPVIENRNFTHRSFYTMLGSCTRHESKNTTSFERLTEFRMREIVFVGDEAGAEEFQRFSIVLFQHLIQCFDLAANIATANDSFFISNYSKYKLMQMLGGEKFEARLLIPNTHSEIAFGSFNHHRHFFSQRFGISYQGEPAVTACVGFGLERLVYGILAQHGLHSPRIQAMLEQFLEIVSL